MVVHTTMAAVTTIIIIITMIFIFVCAVACVFPIFYIQEALHFIIRIFFSFCSSHTTHYVFLSVAAGNTIY